MMRRRIAAAVLAIGVTGCALAAVRGPTPGPHTRDPDCTTASVAPVLDFGGALVWVLGIASVQSLSGLPGGDDPDARARQRGSMILFGGLATLHVASMVIGSRRMSRCKQARDAWRAAQPPAPGGP
jgi:hypothetical protein